MKRKLLIVAFCLVALVAISPASHAQDVFFEVIIDWEGYDNGEHPGQITSMEVFTEIDGPELMEYIGESHWTVLFEPDIAAIEWTVLVTYETGAAFRCVGEGNNPFEGGEIEEEGNLLILETIAWP